MGHVVAIIDPDTNVTSHVEQVLASQGVASQVMADGDVLEFVRTTTPNLILMNVELPRNNGYSLCNRLKRQPDLKGIPIILTSGEATPEAFAQHQSTPTPADAYLRKPFSMEQLLAEAQKLIPGFQVSSVGEMPRLPDAVPVASEASAEAPRDENAPPPRRGAKDKPTGPHAPVRPDGEAKQSRGRGATPTLDEILAQERADEPVAPPPSSAGPEAKLQFLRESLKRRESDLVRARELWAQRDRDILAMQDQLDRKERELERAKKAREDLVAELATRDDELGTLKADVELGHERSERLERERTALARELQDAQDDLERETSTRDQRIAELERVFADEQQARALEATTASEEIAALQSDLETARAEHASRAEQFGRAEAQQAAQIAELSARIAELDVQNAGLREHLDGEKRRVQELTDKLRESREGHAALLAKFEGAREELNARIAELTRDRASTQEDLFRTKRDLDERSRSLAEANGRITDLGADLADAQGQATDLSMQLEASESRGRALSLELEEAQSSALELGQDKSRLEGALEKTRATLADVEARGKELAAELKRTAEAADAESNEQARQIADLKARLEDTSLKLANAKDRITSLDVDVVGKEEVLAELTSALDEERTGRAEDVRRRDAQIADLEERLQAQKRAAHEAERTAKTREASVAGERDQAAARADGLEADVVRTRAKLADIERQVAEGRDKIADLTGQLRRSQADAERKGEDLEGTKARVAELSVSLDEESAKARALEAALAEERAQAASAKESASTQLERLKEEAKSRIQKLQEQVTALKEGASQRDAQLAESETRLTSTTTELERARAALAKEEAAHRSVTERLDALDDELEATKGRAEALGDENTRLKGMLKKATDERDELKREKLGLEDRARDRESTLIKDLESVKKSRMDDEGRQRGEFDTMKKERDDTRAAFEELKRKANEIKRRYDETRAQAKERITQSDQKSLALQEELNREKAERARERAQADAEKQKLRARADDAAREKSDAAEGELMRLSASAKEKDERIAKISTELAEMRDALKQERARAKSLEERASSSAKSAGDDGGYKEKYTELVSKMGAREAQFKERYDKLVERNKALEERHTKVMDAVKRAKDQKAGK